MILAKYTTPGGLKRCGGNPQIITIKRSERLRQNMSTTIMQMRAEGGFSEKQEDRAKRDL